MAFFRCCRPFSYKCLNETSTTVFIGQLTFVLTSLFNCIFCSFSLLLQYVTDERKATVLTALQKQVIESTSVWCRDIHPSNRSYSVFGPAGDKQGNKLSPRPPVIFTGPLSSLSLSSQWTFLSPGGGVYMSCQFNSGSHSKMFFPWSRRRGANEEYEERKQDKQE